MQTNLIDPFYQAMEKLHLTQIKSWTISDNQKKPLDPSLGLRFHFNPQKERYWHYLAKDPDNTLVSLETLYSDPKTPRNHWALRVNVHKQHVFLVDIEHDYNRNLNQYLKLMPVAYGEHSVHGGLHYIVPVSPAILNDDKYKNLFERTQVKIGTVEHSHSGVEIFFNQHYLTFTQNYAKTKNNNGDEQLRQFLDYLVENVKADPKTNKQELIDNRAVIPTDALVIANHIKSKYFDQQMQKLLDNLDDHDKSRYEQSAITKICGKLVNTSESHFSYQPFKSDELINKNAPNDVKYLTWAALDLVYYYLEPREKWTAHRIHDLNYIQYQVNSAMQYVLANDHDINKPKVYSEPGQSNSKKTKPKKSLYDYTIKNRQKREQQND